MIDPDKAAAALERLAANRAKNWLVAVLLIAWLCWLITQRPGEALSVVMAVLSSPGAPHYAMSLIVVGLLVVMFGRFEHELSNSRTEQELCRAEQSAMRSAIVTLLMELPDVSKEKGMLIINALDRAIEDARQRFMPRQNLQQPLALGQRQNDPEGSDG